jgi:hypothetical protein
VTTVHTQPWVKQLNPLRDSSRVTSEECPYRLCRGEVARDDWRACSRGQVVENVKGLEIGATEHDDVGGVTAFHEVDQSFGGDGSDVVVEGESKRFVRRRSETERTQVGHFSLGDR